MMQASVLRIRKSGKISGIINDYINYAKNSLRNYSLEFELVGFDSREEQFQALKDEKIDMIFHISQNPYAAEQNEMSLSNTVSPFFIRLL